MTHTTVYIDFDGVMNPYNHMPPTARSGWRGEWTQTTVQGYSVMWSHNLVEFLRELSEREDVTVKVLSTWTSEWTRSLAPLLGVGHDWAIVGDDVPEEEYEDFANWWKLEALQKDIFYNRPRKVIWIDDDLARERKAQMAFSNYSFETLAISPAPDLGLTREQSEDIFRFIDSKNEERT